MKNDLVNTEQKKEIDNPTNILHSHEKYNIPHKEYRTDDVQWGNLIIYQNPNKYCFSSDPVILANFATKTNKTRALDIGSGSGIIPILLVGKYGIKSCDGVEIQECFVEMSRASIAKNNLCDRITIHHGRIQDYANLSSKNGSKSKNIDRLDKPYDLVISNPPYGALCDGQRNCNESLAIARHEVELKLEELVAAARTLTKYGGYFCMIHQAERLAEICSLLSQNGFGVKRIRPVSGRVGSDPILVMLEAKRGGKVGMKLMRTLELYDKFGIETEELKKIYGK